MCTTLATYYTQNTFLLGTLAIGVLSGIAIFIVQYTQLAVPLFKFKICLYIISLHSIVTLYLYTILLELCKISGLI